MEGVAAEGQAEQIPQGPGANRQSEGAAEGAGANRQPEDAAEEPGANRQPEDAAEEPGANRQPEDAAEEPGANRQPEDAARRAHRARRARIFWPAFIIGLMVIHIGGVAVLIQIATSDPSFQIEEDYYDKALAWDQRMEQDRTNLRLGWKSELSFQRRAPEQAYVQARISDREGLPVAGAEVQLVTFHKARAGDVIRSTMKELAPGTYATLLPAKRSGIWEFRLEARRGSERFTQRVDREL
jgi:nitrogen fixation protein FixH